MKVLHTSNIWKVAAVMVGIALVVWSGFILNNSQNTRSEQQLQSQRAVASHTQTLNEIKQAVTTIEANQRTNSSAIINYIDCLINSKAVTPVQVQQAETICKAIPPKVQ